MRTQYDQLNSVRSSVRSTYAIACVALLNVSLSSSLVISEEAIARPTKFECRWAEEPIRVDGVADDTAWKSAEVIDHFYLPWLGEKARPARTKTAARLLWDREYLYFFATMEDSDLYGDVTEDDGRLWDNDVFELFLKPAHDKPGYYEFEFSPAGAKFDIFIPRRGGGPLSRWLKDTEFNIDVQVKLRGSLNKWQDKDKGWSVEGRIPWKDLIRTGGRPAVDEAWRFALCRYDYSVDFEGPELSTCANLSTKSRPDFHHHEDYAELRFAGPKPTEADARSTLPRFVPVTTSRVVGSPDPPLPYRVERAFPKLELSWPIFVSVEPGTDRLIFIDQERSYGSAKLRRTIRPGRQGEYETLLEFDGVAYSLAFHPQFAENGFIYIGWNGDSKDGAKKSRITRYTIARDGKGHLDPASEKTIIEWPSDGHNGAAIAFGKDGMLYVTTGDGTSDSDTNLKGQGLDHLLAKVLRIDVDRPTDKRPYSIPADNPFVGQDGARGETWAYGLRNPWRMTVDERTGRLWVGNNGQDLWEQVYLVERGANYGWSVYEGGHPFYLNRELGPTPHTKPTLEHHHAESRSLTGGVVYYGKQFPDLVGAYIYGDYSTGKIWAAKHDGQRVLWHRELTDTTLQISAFALDSDGELLIVDHQGNKNGGFYRLVPSDAEKATGTFPTRLSESGLFADVAKHEVQPGIIPYSVNAPLWSDGAFKSRFLMLPGDSPKIKMNWQRSWDFPDGTVLIKSFGVNDATGDRTRRRWIETRFLVKQEGEWGGYSYAWNEEQTDAILVGAEGADRVLEVEKSGSRWKLPWRFPSRTECMVCHSRAANFVLGLSTPAK